MSKQLNAIAEFYNETVREIDKKGDPDLLKQCTETLLSQVNEDIKEYGEDKNIQFTFEDIVYSDGYFIFFSYGTNSVVKFRVKEIPGWLFGIWWDQPEVKALNDSKTRTDVKGKFFAQYEETIDKFKPSRSEFCCEVVVTKVDTLTSYSYGVMHMLSFMHDEPALAFCRDYLGWDYNKAYHSREEAEKEFLKYKAQKVAETDFIKNANCVIINTVQDLLAEDFKAGNAIIYDKGEDWSPRYDIVVNKSKVKNFKKLVSGRYSLEDTYGKLAVDVFNKAISICEDSASNCGVYWSSPIDDSVELVTDKKFQQLKDCLEGQ